MQVASRDLYIAKSVGQRKWLTFAHGGLWGTSAEVGVEWFEWIETAERALDDGNKYYVMDLRTRSCFSHKFCGIQGTQTLMATLSPYGAHQRGRPLTSTNSMHHGPRSFRKEVNHVIWTPEPDHLQRRSRCKNLSIRYLRVFLDRSHSN